MKIYGHPLSTCTRKVLMTCAETKTPNEFVLVDFAKGEHKQPPHVARQPFGRVPALDDDGLALFESRAMMRYINDKAKGALVPANPGARALVEQWISVETSEFTPHAMKYIYEFIFQRKQEEGVLAAAGESLDKCAGVLDKQLAESPYLAGDNFTLADIAYMPYVEYAMQTPAKEKLAKHAHFVGWWNKVSERPTWRQVVGR